MKTKPSGIIATFTFITISIFQSISPLQAQETIKETISHDGVEREYIIYVPEKYDKSVPAPLMLNFHGYTGQAVKHMWASGMRPVADNAGFILVYPQGTLFNNNTHWNVGAWTVGSTADDLGFTNTMIDAVSKKFSIDLTRVYSCGFSNGGYFNFELACKLSHRIAAIGSVGGKMSSETYNECNPSHPTPVVTIHGTADLTVTYDGPVPANSKSVSEVNAFWVNYNGAQSAPIVKKLPDVSTLDGTTVEYYSYTNGDNCVAVDHYKVIGGEHDWPGIWGNQDIVASEIIWNFVSQYDSNGLIECE